MLSSRLSASFRRAGGKPQHMLQHSSSVRPRSAQPSNSLTRSSFSTFQPQLREQTNGRGEKPQGNPEMPQISFKDLGMTRNVKIVVYVAIGILGTIETVFWVQTIWRWLKGEKNGES